MEINQLVKEVHETAKSKGWWTNDDGTPRERNSLELQMLMVSELAEACEEARKGTPPIYWNTPTGMISQADAGGGHSLRAGLDGELYKPEGELIELVDCLVRIFDYCGHKGWDLEEAIKMKIRYNETRSFRHGGKKF